MKSRHLIFLAVLFIVNVICPAASYSQPPSESSFLKKVDQKEVSDMSRSELLEENNSLRRIILGLLGVWVVTLVVCGYLYGQYKRAKDEAKQAKGKT